MRKMNAFGWFAAGLIGLAPLYPSETNAGVITAQTTFNPSGASVVNVSFNGSSGNYYAAPFTTQVWDGGTPIIAPGPSYCVDFVNELNQTVLTANVSNESGIVTAAQGGGGYDRNIGAAGWLMANINPTTSQERAALQVAIWDAIYDDNGFSNPSIYNASNPGAASLTSGLFRLNTTGTIFNLAASYLNQALDPITHTLRTATIVYINYSPPGPAPYSQDQIMLPGGSRALTPEPSTLTAAFAGLVLLGAGYARRRPRSTHAA